MIIKMLEKIQTAYDGSGEKLEEVLTEAEEKLQASRGELNTLLDLYELEVVDQGKVWTEENAARILGQTKRAR